MLTSREYKENLKQFDTADGVKAIVLFGIYILVLFIQGLTYTSNLSVKMLNGLQVIFPLFLLIIGILFVVLSKEKLYTVGLNGINVFQSLLWGVLLALCLVTGMAIYFRVIEHATVGIAAPMINTLGIFVVAAVQEETIFRGYIQTRLTGIIKKPVLSSLCTGFLFLLMHYPTRWVVGGFSLSILPLYYVICLIVLHFVCDFVYKKTNCLWGAIGLHFLYNVGQSMLVL